VAATDPGIKGKRLSPQLRRTQILDAAARRVVAQGYLPVQLERLARDAGTSKALIYAYFPSQYALFNALLEREMQSLTVAGLDTASRVADVGQAVLLCAMLYFEHVARTGPLLHILVSDRYMSGHVDAKWIQARDVLIRRLVVLASKQVRMNQVEIHAAIEMMSAIPEESGRLVFHGELDHATAREVCHELIASSLKVLKFPQSVQIPD